MFYNKKGVKMISKIGEIDSCIKSEQIRRQQAAKKFYDAKMKKVNLEAKADFADTMTKDNICDNRILLERYIADYYNSLPTRLKIIDIK